MITKPSGWMREPERHREAYYQGRRGRVLSQTLPQSAGGVSVGDLYYNSWGYDQTNIDYIMVVGILKSGKTVLCQRVQKRQINGSTVAPSREVVGEKFKMRIKPYPNQDRPDLRGSYHTGYGTKRLTTFYPTDDTKTHYETPAGLGH